MVAWQKRRELLEHIQPTLAAVADTNRIIYQLRVLFGSMKKNTCKNKHDDVPDTLAMFVDWQMADRANIAVVMRRPF